MFSPFFSRSSLAVLLCAGFLAEAPAAVIAEFPINSGNELVSSDPGTSWTTSDATSGFDGFTDTGGDRHAFLREEDLPATGVSTLNVWEFSVTPDVGSPLAFTDFSFNYYSQTASDVTLTLRTSATGSTDLESFTFGQTGSGSPSSGAAFLNHNFDLTDNPALQNVAGPITFSVHLSIDPLADGSSPIRFDDFQLSGTVIPEPAAGLLLLLGAGLLGFRRQRRL